MVSYFRIPKDTVEAAALRKQLKQMAKEIGKLQETVAELEQSRQQNQILSLTGLAQDFLVNGGLQRVKLA